VSAAQWQLATRLALEAVLKGGMTEEEALTVASVYACMALQKRGLSLVPGSCTQASDDREDGTASITFTWKLG
jgi:hypothetical protein